MFVQMMTLGTFLTSRSDLHLIHLNGVSSDRGQSSNTNLSDFSIVGTS